MQKKLNSKNKTLLLVGIVLLLSSAVILFAIKTYQKNVLFNIEQDYSNSMKNSYSKILQKNNDFYVNSINANLESKNVIPLFINNQKKELFANIKPRWDILVKENIYLKEMNLYKTDSSLFLKLSDNNLTTSSNILELANKKKEIFFAFEKYENDIMSKVFVPIRHEGTYQGILEIVISSQQIISDMKYYNNLNGALFIKHSNENFRLVHNTLKDNKLINLLSMKEHNLNKFEHLKLDNITYLTFEFPILDYKKEEIAHAVFFHDITNIINEFDNEIEKVILIILLLLFLTGIVIHFSFKSIIDALESNNEKLQENITLIDKHIISSTTDLKGIILEVSEAFCTISGYKREELLGKPHNILRHSDMDEIHFKDLWQTIQSNKTWIGEIKNKKKDNTFYWVNATISPIHNKLGEISGYTAIRQDISSKKLMEEISITDALTNIFNRRHFDNVFPKIINTSKRKNDLVCLIMMDIDHFKQYNDNYGHQMGDNVLKKLSEKIKNILKRSEDYCFRVGGEEFAIIFKIEEIEHAFLFANTIRKKIENLKIKHEYSTTSNFITVSMGLTSINALDIISPEELYKDTDVLLYKAKESGRNKVCSNYNPYL